MVVSLEVGASSIDALDGLYALLRSCCAARSPGNGRHCSRSVDRMHDASRVRKQTANLYPLWPWYDALIASLMQHAASKGGGHTKSRLSLARHGRGNPLVEGSIWALALEANAQARKCHVKAPKLRIIIDHSPGESFNGDCTPETKANRAGYCFNMVSKVFCRSWNPKQSDLARCG